MKTKKKKPSSIRPKKIAVKARRPKSRKKTTLRSAGKSSLPARARRPGVLEKVLETPKRIETARELEKRPKKLIGPLLLIAGIVSAILVVIFVMVRRENQIQQMDLELHPYEGQYRFEDVSANFNQKVGDQARAEAKEGLLVIKMENGSDEIRFAQEEDGDFKEIHSEYEVTFLKDSEGNILGMATENNKKGISFTLLKVD